MEVVRMMVFAVLMNVSYCLTAWGQAAPEEQGALRQSFEAEYEAWKKDCDLMAYSSRGRVRLESEHFKKIVAMGPAALPYLVEKRLQDPGFTWAGWIRTYIARVSTSPSANPWAEESIVAWWQGGKRQVIQRFDLLNNERENLKSQGLFTQVAGVRTSIRALGIAVLPRIMDGLRAGGSDLIETVQQITGGRPRSWARRPRRESLLAWLGGGRTKRNG